MRVDLVRHSACEGSVTIIDLSGGRVLGEGFTGLHASALAGAPDGRYLMVANAGRDYLSVTQTRTDRVVEKIWVKPGPAELFGASSNAVAFDPSGRRLSVRNGTQNAVTVVDFSPGPLQAARPDSDGWYPRARATTPGADPD